VRWRSDGCSAQSDGSGRGPVRLDISRLAECHHGPALGPGSRQRHSSLSWTYRGRRAARSGRRGTSAGAVYPGDRVEGMTTMSTAKTGNDSVLRRHLGLPGPGDEGFTLHCRSCVFVSLVLQHAAACKGHASSSLRAAARERAPVTLFRPPALAAAPTGAVDAGAPAPSSCWLRPEQRTLFTLVELLRLTALRSRLQKRLRRGEVTVDALAVPD
jgi:hypothetical protein